jgi:hypothetical protein
MSESDQTTLPAAGPLTNDRVWLRRTLWLVGALLVWRLFYAAVVPLDLIHDEAYYWDWSRQLDWGYYSKPPMIAWIIGLSTRLGGSTAWVVRLPAVVLGTFGLLLIYGVTTRLYDRRTGFWATAAAAATPGNTVLGLLITIDAPFLFCWSMALYAFWRFLERGRDRLVWAAATASAIGLGLLSKQTMLGFLALGGLFVLTSPRDRRELIRPALWLTAAGALLFLTPVVWWNSQHDWIMLQHTGEHFQTAKVTMLQRLARAGEYVGGQAGVISPLTALLLILVAAAGLLAYSRQDRRERYLLCFSAVPLVGVLCLSFFQRVEPNWPAAFYTAAIVLLAGWAKGGVNIAPWLDRLRFLFVPGVVLGAVCCAAVYAVPFVLPHTPLHGSKLDPTGRLRGWPQVAEQVDQKLAELPDPDHVLIVSTAGRVAAAELAFYMQSRPRVYVCSGRRKATSQYDVWGGPTDAVGRDALLISRALPRDEVDWAVPPSLRAAFDEVESLGIVIVPLGDERRLIYELWHAKTLRTWPRHGTPAAGS